MHIPYLASTMKVKLFLLSLCFAFTTVAQAQSKKFNQPLADSLAKWVIVDQLAAKVPEGAMKDWSQERWYKYKDSVFSTHQQLLAKVFKQYGYPGYDLVGKQGSNNFWLMVQHCDKTPAFQQQVLDAMKVELAKNNADGKNYAYLIDRVNLNTGKKQLFGTQLRYNTDSCQALPRPMADSLTVNERRKAVGLEPIEEYLNWMSQFHFDMNKESYEKRGITKPKLIKTPKEQSGS